jgi:hypothetical protein
VDRKAVKSRVATPVMEKQAVDMVAAAAIVDTSQCLAREMAPATAQVVRRRPLSPIRTTPIAAREMSWPRIRRALDRKVPARIIATSQ